MSLKSSRGDIKTATSAALPGFDYFADSGWPPQAIYLNDAGDPILVCHLTRVR